MKARALKLRLAASFSLLIAVLVVVWQGEGHRRQLPTQLQQLQKPFTPSSLASKVREALDQPPPSP